MKRYHAHQKHRVLPDDSAWTDALVCIGAIVFLAWVFLMSGTTWAA